MAVSKDSPNRRRSIAVTNQNKSIVVPKGRRRAHSIMPGDRLSPLAKARRSLAPRKSILKTSLPLLNDDTQPGSSQPQRSSQGSANDEPTAQSMDMTASRKSFGRRVSFAEHAQVRLFEKASDTNHTNSTGSPQSSPMPSSDDNPPPSQQQVVNNENDYPAASFSRSRRRSSIRQSLANSEGEDMDLTTVGPSAFLIGDSAIADEEFDYDEYDDDMDVTEVIHGDLIRKRSLSLGVRQPLSQIHASAIEDESMSMSEDNDRTQSSIGDESQVASDADEHSRAMEFTIPLNQSLRPPAHQDEAWLALRQATHSGDTPIEHEPCSDDDGHVQNSEGGMDLNDAMQRLIRARNSLPLSQPSQEANFSGDEVIHAAQNTEPNDDSITSTEDSFDDDIDDGNRTMNVSKVLGRVSLGGAARMSMGYQDSTMDESEIYGAIVPPVQSAPHQPLAQPVPEPAIPEPSKSSVKFSVFQPPPPKAVSSSSAAPQPRQQPTIPTPFSFTPKAPSSPSKNKPTSQQSSPSKFKPKPTFSAAFAPPTRSPKKVASIEARSSPGKRPRPNDGSDVENMDMDKPSPAKRQAMAGKLPGSSTAPSTEAPVANSPKPKPLSPSKKAPFQNTTATSAVRRPSGYFARRKSLAVGLTSAPLSDDNTMTSAAAPVRPSLKKHTGLGLGRVSMGSAPTDAWTRFDKNAGSGMEGKGKGKVADKEEEAAHCVRESARQAIAAPSPTRGSPAPASPRVNSPTPIRNPAPLPKPLSSSLPAHTSIDVSTIMTHGDMEGDGQEEDMEIFDATEQWRENVREEDFIEDDTPVISIDQFFSLTGIKFMDELTAPRRSMHQPSHQPRSAEEIPLSEYVTAMSIDVPQLVLYSRVSKDLQAWMKKSKTVFAQAEEEATKVTPELFVEYARADEEGQAELLHQLNLIRTNTRGLARSDWYDWKLQWVEGLRMTADKAFNDLQIDAKALEVLRATADELVPSLEKQYEEIMAELEKEKAEVAEIEACDQDYLNELKASIAEQNIEVEALKAEVAESNSQLSWLQERLEEIDGQKKEATNAIANAQRVLQMQENSTRSEVFKLKDELEALEDLHMFRATKVTSVMFEYIYASQFRVSIPCRNFLPILTKVDITLIDKTKSKYKDDSPRLSDYLLNSAKQMITDEDDMSVRQVVHRLGDYWLSCAQLRSQLKLLNIKYPVEIEIVHPSRDNLVSGFKAKAMVMFPAVKAKAYVSFIFSPETFSQWPESIGSLDCDVEVAYGPIDRSVITNAVIERLSQATPSESYACLLDACIEAQDVYYK
ncbi:Spc7 kinetochore protein-domain-containing protein [Crucibulum laeve]|uniref:Spc7 kinetochore protein-domain-containing protein n=1 Tax=Crucibulum laeve TaxID=68775 RepID=A0A5C3M8U8_9AGAR|nr:Spc7 kinetochore protein-domain-containing protein [Crucibulum laeve]